MKIKQLMQLIADNANKPQRLEVRQEAEGEATIYLHGVIGGYWGDIDATTFSKLIAGIDTPVINLNVQSPGGDVFEARAIMAAIRAHKSKFIAHITGVAASAATGVTLACDERRITKGAFYMIHNAWTLALGNRHDLQKTADLLGKVDSELADDYVTASGQERSQIVSWMDDETWMTAAETVANGFAHEVVEAVAATSNAAATTWNLAAYDKVPKALLSPSANDSKIAAQHWSAMERRLGIAERAA